MFLWLGAIVAAQGESRGNADFLLGFNWLRFGGGGSKVGVDVFGGVSLGQKNSSFATSRTDAMFGMKTYKNFYQLALEMGFEHHLMGTPVSGDELSVGDIQTFSLELGWRAGPDIFLALKGGTVRVAPQEGGLDQKMNWGYISPILRLSFSSLVGVNIKGNFRTGRYPSREALPCSPVELSGGLRKLPGGGPPFGFLERYLFRRKPIATALAMPNRIIFAVSTDSMTDLPIW